MTEWVRKHHRALSFLLKNIVADKFKRMARDEVLSKFLTSQVDPVLLVDWNWQAEREAIDLAELSLLTLMDSENLQLQLEKSALKIQEYFQKVYGEAGGRTYLAPTLLEWRVEWLRVRVGFYQKWLSLARECDSPVELGFQAFKSRKNFDESLRKIFELENKMSEALVAATPAFSRFLMKKQLENESESSEAVWRDFADQAFKKIPEIPGA